MTKKTQFQVYIDHFFAYGASFYTLWILLSTIAWISHLGERIPITQKFCAAKGYPSNEKSKNIVNFFRQNVPTALMFVLPHSLCKVKNVRKLFGRRGRSIYNVIAALTLHVFMLQFIPLKEPVMMVIPIKREIHDATSVLMLFYAAYAIFSAPETYDLLGVNSSLSRAGARAPEEMDAITWMGLCVYRKGGVVAFVAFTGLSLIPQTLTLGDCLARGVAATYLRLRSKSFRLWLGQIPGAHHATWVLRGSLITFALFTSWRVGEISFIRAVQIDFLGLSLALVLTFAERERSRRNSVRSKVAFTKRRTRAPASASE
jgi:hypothetical protein